MNTKTQHAVLATLIKAGRRDLAIQFVRAAAGWTTFTHKKHTKELPQLFQVKPLKGGGYQARRMQMSGKWHKLADGYELRKAKDDWAALAAALGGIGFGSMHGPQLVRDDWKMTK